MDSLQISYVWSFGQILGIGLGWAFSTPLFIQAKQVCVGGFISTEESGFLWEFTLQICWLNVLFSNLCIYMPKYFYLNSFVFVKMVLNGEKCWLFKKKKLLWMHVLTNFLHYWIYIKNKNGAFTKIVFGKCIFYIQNNRVSFKM